MNIYEFFLAYLQLYQFFQKRNLEHHTCSYMYNYSFILALKFASKTDQSALLLRKTYIHIYIYVIYYIHKV